MTWLALYYTSEEWRALGKDERDAIIAKRKNKKGKKDAKKGSKKALEQRISALESALEEKQQKIAALESQPEDTSTTTTLPPRANANPLQPPAGFTQRGN